MKHRDFVILRKVRDEIAVAQRLIGGMELSEFLKDERTQRAVCMTAINIGELMKALSADAYEHHARPSWHGAARLLDKAAHHDDVLRMDDIWATVTEDFPALQARLRSILENEDDDGVL